MTNGRVEQLAWKAPGSSPAGSCELVCLARLQKVPVGSDLCLSADTRPWVAGNGEAPLGKGLGKWPYRANSACVSPSQRLYSWTQAVVGTPPGPEAGEPSLSEDTLPGSADSGLCCESDSEPGTSLSEPLSPDTWSRAFSAGPELEPEDGLSSLAASEGLPQLGMPAEAIREHGRWLATCIQALEREVTEEELARVDGAVDALARWEMFTGRLPATRQDLPCGGDGPGLRKVLGDKFSSLRRKLSARKPSKADASPCRWKAEEH